MRKPGGLREWHVYLPRRGRGECIAEEMRGEARVPPGESSRGEEEREGCGVCVAEESGCSLCTAGGTVASRGSRVQ